MALCWERYQNSHHFLFSMLKAIIALAFSIGSHWWRRVEAMIDVNFNFLELVPWFLWWHVNWFIRYLRSHMFDAFSVMSLLFGRKPLVTSHHCPSLLSPLSEDFPLEMVPTFVAIVEVYATRTTHLWMNPSRLISLWKLVFLHSYNWFSTILFVVSPMISYNQQGNRTWTFYNF